MALTLIEWIAFLTSTVSLVPQIYKSQALRSTRDLSWLMLLNFFLCSLAWLIYGLILDAKAVWATNAVMLVSSLYLIGLKVRYR